MTAHSMIVSLPTPETVRVEKQCRVCHQLAIVEVPREQFIAWRNGELAQLAFPQLSADEREMLISGTHPECWEKLFS